VAFLVAAEVEKNDNNYYLKVSKLEHIPTLVPMFFLVATHIKKLDDHSYSKASSYNHLPILVRSLPLKKTLVAAKI
jgi:hypothetical protein